MYIVSSFRGGATVKSNIFFVIVFESQKPPHLNGKWGGDRKEGVWKVDGREWKGRRRCAADRSRHAINPRDGGAIDQDYVGRFHYNRKRQLCQARPHLTCTNRTSLKERTCLIPNF